MNRFVNASSSGYHNELITNFSDNYRPIYSGVARSNGSGKLPWVGDMLFGNKSDRIINRHDMNIVFYDNHSMAVQRYESIPSMSWINGMSKGESARYPAETKQYSRVGQKGVEEDSISVVDYSEYALLENNVSEHTFYRNGRNGHPFVSVFGRDIASHKYVKSDMFDVEFNNEIVKITNIVVGSSEQKIVHITFNTTNNNIINSDGELDFKKYPKALALSFYKDNKIVNGSAKTYPRIIQDGIAVGNKIESDQDIVINSGISNNEIDDLSKLTISTSFSQNTIDLYLESNIRDVLKMRVDPYVTTNIIAGGEVIRPKMETVAGVTYMSIRATRSFFTALDKAISTSKVNEDIEYVENVKTPPFAVGTSDVFKKVGNKYQYMTIVSSKGEKMTLSAIHYNSYNNGTSLTSLHLSKFVPKDGQEVTLIPVSDSVFESKSIMYPVIDGIMITGKSTVKKSESHIDGTVSRLYCIESLSELQQVKEKCVAREHDSYILAGNESNNKWNNRKIPYGDDVVGYVYGEKMNAVDETHNEIIYTAGTVGETCHVEISMDSSEIKLGFHSGGEHVTQILWDSRRWESVSGVSYPYIGRENPSYEFEFDINSIIDIDYDWIDNSSLPDRKRWMFTEHNIGATVVSSEKVFSLIHEKTAINKRVLVSSETSASTLVEIMDHTINKWRPMTVKAYDNTKYPSAEIIDSLNINIIESETVYGDFTIVRAVFYRYTPESNFLIENDSWDEIIKMPQNLVMVNNKTGERYTVIGISPSTGLGGKMVRGTVKVPTSEYDEFKKLLSGEYLDIFYSYAGVTGVSSDVTYSNAISVSSRYESVKYIDIINNKHVYAPNGMVLLRVTVVNDSESPVNFVNDTTDDFQHKMYGLDFKNDSPWTAGVFDEKLANKTTIVNSLSVSYFKLSSI